MFSGIQIAGVIFGLIMLYLSNLYYKRKDIGVSDFTFWCSIWLVFIYSVTFPQTLNVFFETLGLQGAMHFFTIGGFMLSFGIIFSMYQRVKQLQKKIEKLVITLAQDTQEKQRITK